MILTVFISVIAIAFILVYIYVSKNKIPSDVIGQADALTQIQILSNFSLDITVLFLFGGIFVGAIALFKAIKLYKTKG